MSNTRCPKRSRQCVGQAPPCHVSRDGGRTRPCSKPAASNARCPRRLRDVVAAYVLRLVGGQDPAARPQTSALLLPHRPRNLGKQSAQPSFHSGAQTRSAVHRDGGIGAMRLVSSKRHADAPERGLVDRQKCLAQHQPAAPSAPQELPAARRGTYGNAGGLACQAAKTSARLARSASRHSGNRLA